MTEIPNGPPPPAVPRAPAALPHPSLPGGPRRLRRIAVALLGGFTLVAALALALAESTGWSFLREPLSAWLQRSAGVRVDMQGHFSLRLIGPPRLAVGHLTVGAGGGVDAPHLLRADGLELRWRWTDLWRYGQGHTLKLRSLTSQHLDGHMVRLRSGAASWQVLPRRPGGAAAGGELPEFESLALGQGRLVVDDDLTALQLTARMHHEAEASDGLPWRAQATGRYRGLPLQVDARAQTDLSTLLAQRETLPLARVRLNAVVGTTRAAFDGATGDLDAGQDLGGELRLQGPSLQATGRLLGVTLLDTPPYQLQARVARRGALWSVSARQARVGTSELTADLRYDSAARPPHLSGRVAGPRLALADLGPSVGADETPRRPGRVLPDARLDLPVLGRMDANVVLDIDQLVFNTRSLAPVQQLQVLLMLQDGQLSLNQLRARLGRGSLRGSGRVEVVQGTPRWEARLSLANVQLEDWVRGLRPAAPTARGGTQGPAPAYLGGTLEASLSLRGQGHSVAEILAGSDGMLQARLNRGHLSHLVTEAAGLDVAEALGTLISGDEPLRLNCALAHAVVRDGVLRSRRVVLDSADTTLLVQGGASLKDETLRLRVVARPKDFSPLSLRTPLTVTGTFEQPQLGVQAGGLVARAAGALLLGSLAPPAALLAFIDPGGVEPDPTAPCNPGTRAHP